MPLRCKCHLHGLIVVSSVPWKFPGEQLLEAYQGNKQDGCAVCIGAGSVLCLTLVCWLWIVYRSRECSNIAAVPKMLMGIIAFCQSRCHS